VLQGRGLASRLAEFGLHTAEASGLPVIVECPFVRNYMRRRGERGDAAR
jgi:predicted GNAT family acetyltransferase